MEVNIQGTPIHVFGGVEIPETLLVSWGVMIVLTCLCIWLTRGLRVHNISTKQAVAEKIVLFAENFVRSNMGEKLIGFVPFVSALFAMSIVSSLSSLIGLFPPTGDVATTLAWAVIVFILITYYKLKTNGLGGYLKGFTEPIFLMTPFNVLGEVFTPVSMAFRHFGNIASGTVITALIYASLTVANRALFGLLPGVIGDILGAIPFLTVGIPAAGSLYFDWFSGFMQAFIFCMLTMVFIAQATEE